jgi:flagellar basal-body rod modification protein FlgD
LTSSILNPLATPTGSLPGSSLGVRAKANDVSASGANAASSSSGDSSTSQTSLSSLGSTFLSLLTQELQNQDPTAPMDSTQMVGQMISLNQLDQLASINQLLTTQFSGSTGSSAGPNTTTQP